eukprot:scaffold55950_cov69-Phaeocystis_antarctica.AAC.1
MWSRRQACANTARPCPFAPPGGSCANPNQPKPLGVQPPPRVLELAASKVAHFTAFDHPGGSCARGGGRTSRGTG